MSALPGCTVYLDDRMVATTDANGQAVIPDVRQGTHSVKVSRDGYEDWTGTIHLTSSQVLPARLVRLSFERRVQVARNHINAGRVNQGLSALQELTAEEPNRPEGYELMGEVYYQQNNFSQARETLGRAIERGGQAQFPVTHDHLGGSDPVDRAKKEWKEFCRGELIITSGLLRFRGGRPGDDFSVKRSDIHENDLNKWVGVEIGAFNLKIRTSGVNFNFAPRTKDREESRMIIGLIKTYVR
ncbi:MAG: carboxypeptidase regulatory-like domain-containing protein [candidate division WOR-3 bacterium]